MKALRVILFALIGLVAGFALTAALGLMLIPASPADSGGTAMGIFFGLAPLGGLAGLIAGIVFALKR